MTPQPIEQVLKAWTATGGNPRRNGDGTWNGLCPAHDDHQPSLSISVAEDGRVLIHCHGGCSAESVSTALGLQMRDLFPPAPQGKPARRLVKTYDYEDPTGNLLFQVCRFEPKDFRQRRPGENGNWIWNLNGTPRVLYRLPHLVKARPDEWIFFTEGEKDADNIADLGCQATTNPGGAGKFRHIKDSSALHNRKVAILPDRDEPGERHALDVADRLHGKAAEVRIIELPGNGKDVSDWIDTERRSGRTVGEIREQLLKLVADTPAFDPETYSGIPDLERLTTDVGNAARFISRSGSGFRYCPEFGRWLFWDGTRWAMDEGSLRALKAAKKIALSILDEAKKALTLKAQARIAAWSLTSQNAQRLRAMLDLARPELAVSPADLDREDFLLNVSNGTLDLRTGELHEHRREDLITKLAPVAFDPAAACPRWNSFLDEIMAGNESLISFIQRLAGLCLTGTINEQYLFIMFGDGANGKNVLLDTLAGLLGEYAAQAPPDLLMERRHSEHPTEIADLCGRRLVVACETEEGGRLRVQFVKRLTGDAHLKGRFMRQDFFEFRRTHKLILVTNNRPVINESTHAIWRRLLLVPFDVTIPPEQQDKSLTAKLKAEWPGILRWTVEGCLSWWRDGLRPPDEVLAATDEYRKEEDPLAGFLTEKCILVPGAYTTREAIFAAYLEFTEKSHERYPMSRKALFERLRKLEGVEDGQRRVSNAMTRGFNGLGLLAETREAL